MCQVWVGLIFVPNIGFGVRYITPESTSLIGHYSSPTVLHVLQVPLEIASWAFTRARNRSTRGPCSRFKISTYPFRGWRLASVEELESARGSKWEQESELLWGGELAPE